MGLSQPKNKQKIGIDPQNKRWKDDKEKIGFKLLSKMGWKEGNGLGAKQDGMQSNIKVTLKENKFGIGANARTSDSWLENSFAFDNLLKGIEETADPTVFKMPDEPSAEKVISSNRYAHRKKFIRNKQVTTYETTQINNILGKPANSYMEHSENLVSIPPVENADTMLDGIVTVTSTVGISDYFQRKEIERRVTAAHLQGVVACDNNPAENDLNAVAKASIKKSKKAKKEKLSKKRSKKAKKVH